MSEENKNEKEVKTSQNEITESNKNEKEEIVNESSNTELRENDNSIELNNENSKEKSISEQSEKIKEDSSSSEISEAYIDSIQNLKILAKMKEDLQIKYEKVNLFNTNYNKMEKEEIKLTGLYKDEDKVNEEIIEKNIIMDDHIFKNRIRTILSDVYDLKEYLCYPYFTVEYSSQKQSNIVKIYYYRISVESNEEIPDKNNMGDPNEKDMKAIDNKSKKDIKDELKNKNVEEFYFLDDRETYMLSYKEMPMIFQKINNIFYSVNIISKDFQAMAEFLFEKDQHGLITTFNMADINKELSDIHGEITRTKNKLDSLKEDNEEKKVLNEKLNILNKMNDFLKKKYSKKNIVEELMEKREKLEYYEERIKLGNLIQKSNWKEEREQLETEINNIKKQIENYEMLLKVITIRITRMEQEFDGLYFSSKKITLKNSIGDTLTIPAKSPIIIEVKNNNNYNEIINNIQEKKYLLESLRLKESNFYFIGILRSLNINEEQKKEINIKTKSLNFDNMIIIYPEKLTFLNVPLYEEKKETNLKNGQNLEDVISIIMKKLEKIEKDVEELKQKFEK